MVLSLIWSKTFDLEIFSLVNILSTNDLHTLRHDSSKDINIIIHPKSNVPTVNSEMTAIIILVHSVSNDLDMKKKGGYISVKSTMHIYIVCNR